MILSPAHLCMDSLFLNLKPCKETTEPGRGLGILGRIFITCVSPSLMINNNT